VSDDDSDRGTLSLAWRVRQRRKSSPDTPRLSALDASLEAAMAWNKVIMHPAEEEAPNLSHEGFHRFGSERAMDAGPSNEQTTCMGSQSACEEQRIHSCICTMDAEELSVAKGGCVATAEDSLQSQAPQAPGENARRRASSSTPGEGALTANSAAISMVPSAVADCSADHASVEAERAENAVPAASCRLERHASGSCLGDELTVGIVASNADITEMAHCSKEERSDSRTGGGAGGHSHGDPHSACFNASPPKPAENPGGKAALSGVLHQQVLHCEGTDHKGCARACVEAEPARVKEGSSARAFICSDLREDPESAGMNVLPTHSAHQGLTFKQTQGVEGLRTGGLERYQPLSRRLWRPELPFGDDASTFGSDKGLAPPSERSGYCSVGSSSEVLLSDAEKCAIGEAPRSRARRRLEATRRRLLSSETSSSDDSAGQSEGDMGQSISDA
jgi:hypothetical protein